jgi:uncharacterized protein
MIRDKINTLIAWKDKLNRKPLIINGARQVGKSWLVKYFGENYFSNDIVIINFEKQRDLHIIFTQNFDVNRIISELQLVLGVSIVKGKTLVFFDEIQSCSEALGSLRYFYEDMPDLHVIAAGSLLDFEFRDQPYPVGRVEIMNLYPMTFTEFLVANNKEPLAGFLKQTPKEIPESVENILSEQLQLYFIIGGMPECVKYYIDTQDFTGIKDIQNNLLYTYEQDFKKYKPNINSDCLQDIIENITKLIGNQIIYTKLSDRFTIPTIKKGVDLLKTARLIDSVPNVSIAGLPLTPSGKQFKMFFLDIGLLIRKRQIEYASLYTKRQLTSAFEGVLAEQFVAQQILAHTNDHLFYWSRTEPGANSEIDFIVVQEGRIIPVEVKAGGSGSLKSLHYLLEKYPHIEKGVVYSLAKQGVIDKINFLPIYYAGISFE